MLARNINVPGQLDSCDASELGMLNELKQARHLDVYLYCLEYENGCHKYRSLRKSGKKQISTETSTDATCIHTNIGNAWHCLTQSVNCRVCSKEGAKNHLFFARGGGGGPPTGVK